MQSRVRFSSFYRRTFVIGTVIVLGNAAQPGRVFNPVVEGEGKVRAENGDWFFTVCRMAIVLVHG